MKEWSVQVPFAGFVFVDGIIAETEEESIEKALAKAEEYFGNIRMPSDKNKCVSVEEINSYKIICEGNICHISLNEASSELVDEYDDEDEDDDEDDEDGEEDDEDLDEEEDEEDTEEDDDDSKEA